MIAARNHLAELLDLVAPAVLVAIADSPEAIDALRRIRTALADPAAVAEDPRRMLSKGELAKKLGVSVSTVDRLVRDGMPIAAHVGDARRFDFEVCKAWLAARGKRPTTEAA